MKHEVKKCCNNAQNIIYIIEFLEYYIFLELDKLLNFAKYIKKECIHKQLQQNMFI